MNQQTLKHLLIYAPNTGVFTWKVPHGKMKPGTVAGYINNLGYRIIMLYGHNYRAGRLAWLYIHGYLPNIIDHTKHWEKSNDSINNLELSSYQDNAKNMPKRSDNTSGITGITWDKARKKWAVQFRSGSTKVSKRFIDFFEACCYRKSLEVQYNFSQYHGK